MNHYTIYKQLFYKLLFSCCILAITLPGLTIANNTVDNDTVDKVTRNVSKPHGPSQPVSFTTTEGTWMNVDISPDGSTLAFDLLGDIYTISITGGKAKAIAKGPALQIQPRFSPDGKFIAFTSDQGGGDNIWLMKPDGTNQKPITDENYRLLNNPSWTPDSQYIIARKHFTGRRSLGAGEMWMYHISANNKGGIQLTERRNEQLDSNEPNISPDGRYLFYSEDSSSGDKFKYNKNANKQIYHIRRMDLATGNVSKLIGGAGGAASPHVSPDGKFIAFVRRQQAKTLLYLYQRDNGAHIPLYDGLDHDQQEAWAIYGVYPDMCWTPDNRHLIFWAKGKLWKLNISSRDLQEIPFTVDVQQTIIQAPRFKQVLDAETFIPRMINTAITSPDGKILVFQAAGHLWKKRLPSGKPVRLTRSHSHFEYDANISSDGRWLLYSHWSDKDYGHIYKLKLSGKKPSRPKPQRLSSVPGYYHTPRFSPDGSKIVFRKSTGNNILGNLYGINTGLYWMSSKGGPYHFIRTKGNDPRFNQQGNRIFFKSGRHLKTTYRSIDLYGANERKHFDLGFTTNVVPSPDNQWLAFIESYHIYATPFPKTGIPYQLSKDNKNIPIIRLSENTGRSLHWSADSQKIFWLNGSDYFSRNLTDLLAKLEQNHKVQTGVPEKNIPVGLKLTTDKPSGQIAFKGARIITMNNDTIIENGTIIIKENRITAIGPSSQIKIPESAKLIDASGKTIMPGLIDVHGHSNHFFSGPYPHVNWAYYVNLAFGVTTLHDPSAGTETVFSQSERIKAGHTLGPRLFSTGRILYGAKDTYSAKIHSMDDARFHIQRMKNVGAFSVKSYNQPRREQRQQILQAARELEVLAIPEGGSSLMAQLTMLIDGHPGIEHGIPVAPLYNDMIKLWSHTDVHYTPTQAASFGGVSGEYYFYQHSKVWDHQRLLRFFPKQSIYARASRIQMLADDDYHVITISKTLKKLADAGVKINLGSHGQLQGLGSHWELWLMALGGVDSMELLKIATINGARYLGLDNHIGSLEKGKLADLIVLDKNPLENIRHTEFIKYVMINGRLFDAETMDQIGNHPKKRPAFYWERGLNSENIFGTDPWGNTNNHTH